MELGKNIVKIRKLRGLKAKQLAELVGIDQSYLSQIENEKRSPSLEVIQKIAKVLGTTVSELLGETPQQLSDDMQRLVDVSKKLSSRQIDAVINVVREMDGSYEL